MIIELSFHEIYMAACIGVARRLASLKRNETNKVQNKDFGWHTDIEAACAELAVAKFMNIYWDGSINSFKKADLSLSVQIRHTQLLDGSLILREKDCPEETYILVVGTHPQYRIVGCIIGKDGMRDDFLKNPGGKYPAWFVPQNILTPLNKIIKLNKN